MARKRFTPTYKKAQTGIQAVEPRQITAADVQADTNSLVDKGGTAIASFFNPAFGALAQVGIGAANKVRGDGTDVDKNRVANVVDPFGQFKDNENILDVAESFLLPFGGKNKAERLAERVKKAQREENIRANTEIANRSIGFDSSTEQLIAQNGLDLTEGDNEGKKVEVERNELVFRRVNGRFKLIADFKGGETHEAGGIDITAQPGDVIFPASKRSQLLEMLDVNGNIPKINEPKFQTERLKLPKDEPIKMFPDTPVPGSNENSQKEIFRFGTRAIDGGESQKEIFQEGTQAVGEGFDSNQAIGIASQLLPAISNLVDSTKKARKETRRFVTPQRVQFEDTSQLALNDIDEAFQVAVENITRSAGGSAGVVLSNIASAAANKANAESQVRGRTANQAQQVANINTQIANQANQINTQLATQFDTLDAQNEAARQLARSTAISQLSDVGQNFTKDKQLQSRDAKAQRAQAVLLSTVGSRDFDVNADAILNFIETGQGDLNNLINFRGGSLNEDEEQTIEPIQNPVVPRQPTFQGGLPIGFPQNFILD